MDKPRARYVEAFPVDVEGRQMIYLRDPEGFAPGLAVPQPAYGLMTLMDGTRSVKALQEAVVEQFGLRVANGDVAMLVQQLDESFLLLSDRFCAHRIQVEKDFRQATIRPSAHAGLSYPDDSEELRRLIDSFFDSTDGPGRPNGTGETSMKALIAPHIDFNRGGPCFAWAYKALAESPPPDVFVVLGTGHSARQSFVMSRKDFNTPFGTLKADREVIDQVAAAAPLDVFADEYAHKAEHSLEFQVVFLKYLFPDCDIPFVPILCGSFHEMVEEKHSPMSAPVVSQFIDALKTALIGKRVCFIAGVDLSHVGQRFGDVEDLSKTFLEGVEKTDRELLSAAAGLDAEAYFDAVIREGDRTRVCGTSSIYTMLQVMDAEHGELLRYDQTIDHNEPQQMVSFAGMAFY